MAKKKLIGVIIDSMDGSYEKKVSEHLIRSAIGKNVNLMFFVGAENETTAIEGQEIQSIFTLVNPTRLDGVILVLSSMMRWLDAPSITNLVKRLKNVPMASISIPVEGAYNVLLNNRKAMNQLIAHMETHYTIEETAFIGGPSYNYEAIERKKAYFERLEAAGVSPEGRYYEGDFFMDSGRKAIQWFYDHGPRLPRAIIVANDEMAMGVFQQLATLGKRVPEDVAVCGLDNLDTTEEFFPPITTYDQFLNNLCSKALRGLLGLIDGTGEVTTILTEGQMLIRESCGCQRTPYPQDIEIGDDMGGAEENKEAIARLEEDLRSDATIEEFLILLKKTIMPSAESAIDLRAYSIRLMGNFIRDLKLGNVGSFLRATNSLINHATISDGNTDLQKMTYGFRRFFLSRIEDKGLARQVTTLLAKTDQVISKGIRMQEKQLLQNFRQMYSRSRMVVTKLNNSTTLEEMYQVIQESLPYYSIHECYIALYKRPMDYNGFGGFVYPKMTELVFAYDGGGQKRPQSFVTKNMLPTEILYTDEQKNLIFLALHAGQTHYGYIALSADALDPLIYETLRSLVSEALKRQQMNRKRLEAERALNNVLKELEMSNELLRWQSVRDELTGLFNRRGFYREAEAYFEEAVKSKEPFWAVFGDIDKLKEINDLYGHNEGDYAIRKIGHALKNVLPETAIVARVSGDEFTALIKNEGDEAQIKAYVKGVTGELKGINKAAGKAFDLNISLGYAAYDYKQLTTMDDLLRVADSNLYRAKERKKR